MSKEKILIEKINECIKNYERVLNEKDELLKEIEEKDIIIENLYTRLKISNEDVANTVKTIDDINNIMIRYVEGMNFYSETVVSFLNDMNDKIESMIKNEDYNKEDLLLLQKDFNKDVNKIKNMNEKLK